MKNVFFRLQLFLAENMSRACNSMFSQFKNHQLNVKATNKTYTCSNLREFVVTAVILTPGACGREGLGNTLLRRSGGSEKIRRRVPN